MIQSGSPCLAVYPSLPPNAPAAIAAATRGLWWHAPPPCMGAGMVALTSVEERAAIAAEVEALRGDQPEAVREQLVPGGQGRGLERRQRAGRGRAGQSRAHVFVCVHARSALACLAA